MLQDKGFLVAALLQHLGAERLTVLPQFGQVALTQLLQIGLLRTCRLCQSGRCGAERDAARREVAVVHQVGSEQRGADQAEDQGQQQCGAGRRAKGHW